MDERSATPAFTDLVAQTVLGEKELAREQMAAAWQLHVEKVSEQLQAGWEAHIQFALEERFASLQSRLQGEAMAMIETQRLAAERRADSAAAAAAAEARQSAVAALHQALRRFTKAESPAEIYSAVVESACRFVSRCAIFEASGGFLRGVRAQGFPETAEARIESFEAPLAELPAFAGVVESAEPVITLASTADLSPAVLHALCLEHGVQRAILLPLLAGPRVAAVVYTDDDAGAALPPLELILGMASPSLDELFAAEARRQEAEEAEAAAAAGLIAIQPAAAATSTGGEGAAPPLEALAPEIRERHALARRFARIAVAEMRLYKSAAVLAGRSEGNIYGALRNEIDMARLSYQEQFLQNGGNMLDYLHLELVRTLANNDLTILGPDYPGPLA